MRAALAGRAARKRLQRTDDRAMARSRSNQANEGESVSPAWALLVGATALAFLAGMAMVLLPLIPVVIGGMRAATLLRIRRRRSGRPRTLPGSGTVQPGRYLKDPIGEPMRVSAASAQGR